MPNHVMMAPFARRFIAGFAATLASCGAATAACPAAGKDGIVFPDDAILMSTPLAVNPDGAVASYMPGDHGYTYINNGVNLIGSGGARIACSKKPNQARCHEAWLRAESGGFGPGTPEFCVYAIEVVPLRAGAKTIACELPTQGRLTVGNGKGRPKEGASMPDVSGRSIASYVSTTTLRHTRDGEAVYVDSAAIPGLVVPTSRASLVGAIAWVRYRSHEAFAIVNDTGPAFGEGSVALHQKLQAGAIGPPQPIGPIATKMRCTGVESGLAPPFVSKPSLGKTDTCRPGHAAKGPADIRAYAGIDKGVVTIILAKVKPPMRGRVVTEELTAARLESLANAQGYTPEKLHAMAACLPKR